MRAYHIALYPVESEVALGIALRSRRVNETVKAVAFIRHMPVVKKVIVKERTAHERALVHTEGQLFRYAHAQPCNAERMLVYVDCRSRRMPSDARIFPPYRIITRSGSFFALMLSPPVRTSHAVLTLNIIIPPHQKIKSRGPYPYTISPSPSCALCGNPHVSAISGRGAMPT